MGNCHAAEISGAVVEYPGGRVERLFDLSSAPLSAQHLMSHYPGHFVAVISSSIIISGQPYSYSAAAPCNMSAAPAAKSSYSHGDLLPKPPAALKLLAADAPLRVGHRYRLISFEEVLTYFSQGGGKYTGEHGAMPVAPASSTNMTNANRRLMSKLDHYHVGARAPDMSSSKGITAEGRPVNSVNNHSVKIGC